MFSSIPSAGVIPADKLIFGDSFNYEPLGPTDLISLEVTENGRFLLLSVARGVPVKRVDVYCQELGDPDEGARAIIHGGRDDHYSVVNYGEDVFALTDNEAPKNRVVKIVIDDPHPTRWTKIVPEGKELVTDISISRQKALSERCSWRHDPNAHFHPRGQGDGRDRLSRDWFREQRASSVFSYIQTKRKRWIVTNDGVCRGGSAWSPAKRRRDGERASGVAKGGLAIIIRRALRKGGLRKWKGG